MTELNDRLSWASKRQYVNAVISAGAKTWVFELQCAPQGGTNECFHEPVPNLNFKSKGKEECQARSVNYLTFSSSDNLFL